MQVLKNVNIKFKKEFDTGNYFAGTMLFGIAVFAPFFRRIVPLLIAILTIHYLFFQIRNKSTKKQILINHLRNNIPVVFMILFFILYCIGISYTSYVDLGITDIILKLPILLIPLFYLSPDYSKKHLPSRDLILYGITIGSTICMLYCFIRALYLYFTTDIGNSIFFYTSFSPLEHTTYVSFFMNISLLWVLFKRKLFIYVSYPLAYLLILTILLLSSRMGIITMSLIFTYYIAERLFIKKKIISSLIMVVIILLSIFLVFSNSNRLMSKLSIFFSEIKKEVNIQEQKKTTEDVRITIWKTAYKQFSKKPLFGYGTGSAKQEMIKSYKEEKLKRFYENKWNAHNQFLQTGIDIGVIGIIILLLILGFSFYKGFYNRDIILISFALITFLNFLPESILEIQSGVTIFALLFPVIIKDSKKNNKKKASKAFL
ncbi:MAG: O-antigen ligase family protein [Hyphomicrobiales bacterium]